MVDDQIRAAGMKKRLMCAPPTVTTPSEKFGKDAFTHRQLGCSPVTLVTLIRTKLGEMSDGWKGLVKVL